MSKPLRLVPQAAQPIEFRCPLCGSVHAAYIFGTSQFRIFRCGGCALTFAKTPARNVASPFPAEQGDSHRSNRNERDHSSLSEALDSAAIKGPVLVVADPQDDLLP